MKSFRRIPALLMMGLALCGCSSKGYAGTYQFQMGKNSGAHAMAAITLTDDPFLRGDKTYGKKMTISGQMKLGPSSSSETSKRAMEQGITLPGYYTIGEPSINHRNRLHLGMTLDFLADLADAVDSSLDPSEYDLPAEVVEKFVFGEIEDNKIFLKIPVSFTDLQLQLYWYGVDVPFLSAFDGGSFFSSFLSILTGGEADPNDSEPDPDPAPSSASASAPSSEDSAAPAPGSDSSSSEEESIIHYVPEHAAGTQPTEEEIAEINKTYPDAHGGLKFRSFYTVAISLMKQ